jgi:hypothetical protein
VVASAPVEERRAILDRDLAEAATSVRQLEPDAIFVLLPWSATETIDRCAETFVSLPVEIHLGPEQVLYKFEEARLSTLGPVASLQLTRRPLTRRGRRPHRGDAVFDPGRAPDQARQPGPDLFRAAALRLQSAAVSHHQVSHHAHARRRVGDPAGAAERSAADQDRPLAAALEYDEVPQLFNVLTGDMSLVGPRPHALSHDREYEQRISRYARRHNVRPGITGWAQIHGYRGETDTEEKMRKRVEYDLYYIDNCSLWLDFKIMVRTVLSRSAYRNAY